MQLLATPQALLLLASCSSTPPSITEEQSTVDYGVLLTMPVEPILFDESVKPVLENRCVVCHGCTDAPCQLKLSSYEGITRGANKDRVYNGTRLSGVPPSRLFIDARTTPEWRSKGFHAVVAEHEKTPEEQLVVTIVKTETDTRCLSKWFAKGSPFYAEPEALKTG